VRPRRAQSGDDPTHERARGEAPGFDPRAHARELEAIIEAVVEAPDLGARDLDRIVRSHPRRGSGLFSKSEIIRGFRTLAPGRTGMSEAAFVERLRLRPVRTLSGVTPVTVLTKPFPCPGVCVFCPSDVRMPKSYLADEPGAQRAEANRFDPYLQTWNRLEAYHSIGHPVDKVELSVLGGTWSAYPAPYQVWFTKRCFDALNDFGAGVDGRSEAGEAPAAYRTLAQSGGIETGEPYNRAVHRLLAAQLGGERLHTSEATSWVALAAAQRRNESAACRSVGLVFETRPDCVTRTELRRLRRLGATKVQLGIQSLSDRVLRANRRGHDVAATREAMQLLRAAGFKIHAHWMPNLLGATPAQDVADFARLFDEPDFRPDELKLYPCMLVESADLMTHHECGAWRAYDDEELLEVLVDCMAKTPRYCRLTRVIRDFSAHDVVAGTHRSNLREVAEQRLAERGIAAREIRSREIRGAPFERAALRLEATRYATSVGEELFLEYVTPEDRLVAFLRLSLPEEASFVQELGRSALIREVHVYGASLPLGTRSEGGAQHAGLGRALIEEAERRARAAGFDALAVISAVGTRAYYRELGFADGALYQHRPLVPVSPERVRGAPRGG
jgi:elongator complex protein 3